MPSKDSFAIPLFSFYLNEQIKFIFLTLRFSQRKMSGNKQNIANVQYTKRSTRGRGRGRGRGNHVHPNQPTLIDYFPRIPPTSTGN